MWSNCKKPRRTQTPLETAHLKKGSQRNKVTPQCPMCNLVFRNEDVRKRHVDICHAVDSRKKCDYCDMRFNSVSDLNKHVLFRHPGINRGTSSYSRNKGQALNTDSRLSSQCFDCGCWFRNKREMWSHKNYQHASIAEEVPTANRFDPLSRQGNFLWE